MNGPIFADSFSRADDPQRVATTLVADCPELGHLERARILCLFSQATPMLHGWPCRAFIAEPRVQGPFRQFFQWALADLARPLFDGELPDFVVMVDAAVWPSLDARRQRRLLFHELYHVVTRDDEFGIPRLGEDGRLLLKLQPHEHEFFTAEVARFGPDTCDLHDAATALADGYRFDEERRRRETAA